MLSEWLAALGLGVAVQPLDSPDRYLDGSPLDRLVLSGLLIAGVVALARRHRKMAALFRSNGPIIVFFAYCALSTLWSDYTGVAFKRWVKSVGDLVIVLIVVTDEAPSAALQRVLKRVGFLVIPTSVLLIKYFPDLGRGYHPWTWLPYYTGVTTGKNLLGMVCLLFGLGFVWRLVQEVRGDGARWRTGPLVANGALLAMVFWLFWMANSMTSLSCFVLGVIVIMTTSMRRIMRNPGTIHALVAALLVLSFVTLFLDTGIVETMGRDPTLTGRSTIWKLVLGMVRDPFLGTGFESFWLGSRLDKLWSLYWWHPNEAHNGYLEVYLTLGWAGVGILTTVLITGYQKVVAGLRSDPSTGGLRLALFVVAITYNCTESAIRVMDPVWTFLLLSILFVPRGSKQTRTSAAAVSAACSTQLNPSLEEL